MTRRLPRLGVLLSAALLLAACGGAPAGGSASPGAAGSGDLGALDGRTFLSTSVENRPLAAGTRVTLRFDGTQLGFSAGCNSMGAAVTLADGRLRLGQVGTTEMLCDPAKMAQDTWLAAFLDGVLVALDGDTLTLTKEPIRMTLQDRETADPDRPLEGSHWVVDGLISGDAVSGVPAGVVASLDFAGGRVSVVAGCNRGAATYAVTGGSIAFGPLGLTKMACEAGAMAVERAVAAVLAGSATFMIEAGSLVLRNGPAGLTLKAVAAP